MSSHSFNLLRHHNHHKHRHRFRSSSPIPPFSISFSYSHQRTPFAVVSKPRAQENGGVFQSDSPVLKWNEVVDEDIQEKEAFKGLEPNKIKELVYDIKSMLGFMENGEISCSAYDTAWVALIEDVNGTGSPQFPSTLEWIANNQLSDGSWGDEHIFVSHDRLINTLACVVALKTWNIHPEKYEKGVSFFKENISKLKDENAEHMPIGFEVVFPSLLEIARTLNIEVPYDSPMFQDIYEQRELKLTKIPKEIMHNVPTTLLHSLEGMQGLDWEKLLKLQCQDGSLLFSPSSTAFAFMQTKDQNCLEYLTKIVRRFDGGVPNVYPVDLFEHIWTIDRLQRLGISRYFNPEIKQCLDYIHRYWTEEGICWARNTRVNDIDDTAMGFRLLRLHGYDVSADVFRHFEKGGEFFCFAGQSNQAVTGIFNLYRASQVRFPGDKILEDASRFSTNFLRQKQAARQLLDKWIITKDLPGEVGYALRFPWHASLPRVESRFYIQQYGGEDDIWIGKTLYRMPYVNNNTYLEFAKLDFNNCQALHQMEWISMQKWYSEMDLGAFGMSRRSLLLTYFMAAASIFEPERTTQKLIDTLLRTLNHLSLDALVAHGRDISRGICHAWEKWMLKWVEEGDRHQGVAELVVQMINLTSGCWSMEELVSHPQYKRLSDLTDSVCYQLCYYQKQKVQDNGCFNNTDTEQRRAQEIESTMQELAQLVLQNSSEDIDSEFKQTFLTVARSFYYAAHCDLETTVFHIAKVLFEKVD
ncbi:Ent-copalyl diphosphate synthase [Hibiscus syriacus]|uniref:Ent-copalyl diphosphate synthase n=1 Tax=Hibiscus syriacus TaxID=106335 RepID=A0A6A2WL80_HIBSY|nr:Ent-copalyl diphosphate synthase [Hibiscus syriacus]